MYIRAGIGAHDIPTIPTSCLTHTCIIAAIWGCHLSPHSLRVSGLARLHSFATGVREPSPELRGAGADGDLYVQEWSNASVHIWGSLPSPEPPASRSRHHRSTFTHEISAPFMSVVTHYCGRAEGSKSRILKHTAPSTFYELIRLSPLNSWLLLC